MSSQPDYNNWTRAGLIEKVRRLENELSRRPQAPQQAEESVSSIPAPQPQVSESSSASVAAAATTLDDAPSQTPTTPKKPKGKRKPDPSKYTTRYIALKIAYLGKTFGGFEFSSSANQPTIEEELWKALTKACLVFPPGDDNIIDFDCCEYSKCGRTDRGVSAFGQVIGLRVRSSRPLPKKRVKLDEQAAERQRVARDGHQEEADGVEEVPEKPFDPVADELDYPRVLNRILPPEIRVLAWCHSPPPDFSARFSCRERQYRYFFTQPAFPPARPSLSDKSSSQGNTAAAASAASVRPGWLDIDAMRDAAKRFEGEHDFRNVCKTDAAKQITNFERLIFESDIVEVQGADTSLPHLSSQDYAGPYVPGEPLPKVYSFNVRGSAFLWHQIRHMVAILFLVGQGLEQPSVVSELLDVKTNPRKPTYTMANEVPLVLWDCIFPEEGDASRKDSLQWVHVGDDVGTGQQGLMEAMWATWRERKMDELLANQLLREIAQHKSTEQGPAAEVKQRKQIQNGKGANASAKVHDGGNGARSAGKYVPVMKKDKMETPDELNDKYAKRKGYANAEDMREKKGFRAGKVKESEAESS